MHQFRLYRPVLWITCALVSATGWAGQTVVLQNGYQLEVEGHRREGDRLHLSMAGGGWISVPAAAVATIQPEAVPTLPDRGSPDEAGDRDEASIQGQIEHAARQAGLPHELIQAVVWAESGFRPEAISPKGAMGLMQLMPATAAELGVDPLDATENLEGGVRYLKTLLQRFRGDPQQLVKALASYNAGPGAVRRHSGLPPYSETVAFVGKVVRRYLETPPEPGSRRGEDRQFPAEGRAVPGAGGRPENGRK